jgi:hypothetical protein
VDGKADSASDLLMLNPQTWQILSGAALAVVYSVAVVAFGCLIIDIVFRRPEREYIIDRIGSAALLWLAFIMGQGFVGLLWFGLAMGGILHEAYVWALCILGWCYSVAAGSTVKREVVRILQRMYAMVVSIKEHDQLAYLGIAIALVSIGLLWGIVVLVPPDNYDAAVWYLTVAKVVAFTHTVEFQPFVIPHAALYPLQIEMHWAALFTISNETAVTVWDYLCALSFLYGVGWLARSLTSSKKVGIVAALFIFSSSGFYNLIGAGKTDIAAAQYGVAAFLWLTLWSGVGRKAIVGAGLCAGWTIAARYTNVIVIPALVIFLGHLIYKANRGTSSQHNFKEWGKTWLIATMECGVYCAIVVVPMLIKNWLLVGCPLAPLVGCANSFWYYSAVDGDRTNLATVDLLLYPFVWTYKHLDSSYGNISPLYVGSLLPLVLAYRHVPLTEDARMAGIAGLLSIVTWLCIKPLVLYTRWLFIPMALLAVPLSAILVVLTSQSNNFRFPRQLVKTALYTVVLFLFFQTRAALHGIRYLASMDSRAQRYSTTAASDYGIIKWLNAHVEPGERVAMKDWRGYKYLVHPDILLNSESAEELQWLHERGNTASLAQLHQFYVQHGFSYIIRNKQWRHTISRASEKDLQIEAIYTGDTNSIFQLRSINSASTR